MAARYAVAAAQMKPLSSRAAATVARPAGLPSRRFISSGADPMRVVARRSGPTYAWQARRTCWRRLPVADPRTLTDIGLPFPYGRAAAKAMPPQRTAGAWILSTENPDDFWFLATQTVYKPTAKRFVVYTIDARSGHVRAITITALKDGNSNIRARRHPKTRWWTAQLKVTTLSSVPRLPNLTPVC